MVRVEKGRAKEDSRVFQKVKKEEVKVIVPKDSKESNFLDIRKTLNLEPFLKLFDEPLKRT